jgi:hypothetical protein
MNSIGSKDLSPLDFGRAFLAFILVSLGGVLIGILFALLTGKY